MVDTVKPNKHLKHANYNNRLFCYVSVLVAEIMQHYFPRYVEIHNYVSANSTNQKLNNWGTLNRQVII